LPKFENFNQAKTKLKDLYGPTRQGFMLCSFESKGSAMQMKQFQSANKGISDDKSKGIAEWAGKARADFDKLTDAHETR
jgi:hypothetical protein